VSVWYDVHGDGPAVVLLHAGLSDSRMWGPQLRSFPRDHTVLRVDLPGFGRSPIESSPVSFRAAVREALDAAGVQRAAFVGTSLGGNTALELALESPERVSALVLVGAGLPSHEWSEEVKAYFTAEDEALEQGDLDAAVDVNLRTWLAGPNRSLDQIDLELQQLVADMQRQAFQLQREWSSDLRLDRLEPPYSERLADVRAPALVLTGDEDVHDIHQIADRLMDGLPDAQRARIADAAHLPSLERPEEFDALVLEFLQTRDG
jgi:3-oxoadipate enol-lactonase